MYNSNSFGIYVASSTVYRRATKCEQLETQQIPKYKFDLFIKSKMKWQQKRMKQNQHENTK